jgi:glycosyltransferase involved in cell wall biosynthesis
MKVCIGADPGGPHLGHIFPFSRALIDFLEARGIETTLDLTRKADIAVCVAFRPGVDAVRLLAQNGARIVHRLDGRCRSIVKCYDMDEVVRQVNAYADWTVYQSLYIERHATEHVQTLLGQEAPLCPVSPRASIIYNGVNTAIFRPEGPKVELKGKINILHVAISAGDRKKAAYVVEMAKLLAGNPDIHFTMIGQQDKDLRCSHIIKDNLLPNITHLGPILSQQELARYMRASTVLLFPSVNDYCPNTVLEAMSCGLPIWYDDSGGTPELIRDGLRCAGAPINESNPLWPLDSLLNNHKEFRQDGLDIIRDRFTAERMGEDYLALFRQLLDEPRVDRELPL